MIEKKNYLEPLLEVITIRIKESFLQSSTTGTASGDGITFTGNEQDFDDFFGN